ncbi:MAG: TerC family protein [Candidatus Delongbacteria bacterium]|nr:TerC family protein [Candidatus Delongbacteria bacterium]
MLQGIGFWIGFNAFILLMLGLDLIIFNRKPHQISLREAAGWSIFWIAISLLFNLGLYLHPAFTSEQALQFFTGYLLEKSLSVDNLFVFIMIFSYFKVEARYQHGVLVWGIIGAIIMRSIMIILGGTLIHQYHWILYIFGAFLIYTSYRMLISREEKHPEKNFVVRFIRRILPISDTYDGRRFFTRQNGRLLATPLLLVLVTIEVSDVVFAFDSIPAIFAITDDVFIVYTSNIFAILGMRALYFVLADILEIFHFLKYGLALILFFIGIKLLCSGFFEVPVLLSLLIIFVALGVSVLASLIWKKKQPTLPS